MINKFNVRVYGIFIQNKSVLLVKENYNGYEFTKFPGGGLEFGEGLIEGLKREIREELNLGIEIIEHFYTTDFFQQSRFFSNEQVISVYYIINIIDCPDKNKFPIESTQNENHKLVFFWKEIISLKSNILTFPIDKHVGKMIKEIFV